MEASTQNVVGNGTGPGGPGLTGLKGEVVGVLKRAGSIGLTSRKVAEVLGRSGRAIGLVGMTLQDLVGNGIVNASMGDDEQVYYRLEEHPQERKVYTCECGVECASSRALAIHRSLSKLHRNEQEEDDEDEDEEPWDAERAIEEATNGTNGSSIGALIDRLSEEINGKGWEIEIRLRKGPAAKVAG